MTLEEKKALEEKKTVEKHANGTVNGKSKEKAEVKPAAPETFAKKVEIIIPPPDLKVVVDRTADFVRRVGAAFEKEIIVRNARSKKFNFLKETSPYHAYYKQRLQYGDKPPPERKEAAPPPKKVLEKKKEEEVKIKKPTKKVKVLTLKEKLEAIVKGVRTVKMAPTEEPPPDKYTIKIPEMFQPVDIDVIRLTSQFVARNGRSFLSGLTAREQRNPQFDFLKPTHPLFPFFQQLVDAYAQIIIPQKKMIKDLRQKVENRELMMQSCLTRAKYKKMQLEEEERQKQNEESERVAMALIDWHHFVVVETITFKKEEEPFLPRPRETIHEMNAMLTAQELPDGGAADAADALDLNMEEDMDVDEDDDEEEEEEEEEDEDGEKMIDMKFEERTITYAEERKQKDNKPETIIDNEPEPQLIKSLKTSNRGDTRNIMFQKCPVCGEEIAVDDLDEHIRIELLDPKWKEHKQRVSEKARESSLAASASISANLSALARKRSDVFINKDEIEEEKKNVRREQKALMIWEAQKKKEALAAKAREEANRQAKARQAQQQVAAAKAAQQATEQAKQQVAQARISKENASASSVPIAKPPAPQQKQAPPPPPPPNQPPPPPSATMVQSFGQSPFGRPPIPGMRFPMPGVGNPLPPMPNAPPASIAGMVGRPPLGLPFQVQMRGAPDMRGEPPHKKFKNNFIPEEIWIKQHPTPVKVDVAIPKDSSHSDWNFSGQLLGIIMGPTETVLDLKKKISTMCNGMPTNKMKINFMNGIFLNKDSFTMAYYNVISGVKFQLGVRERGGRNK